MLNQIKSLEEKVTVSVCVEVWPSPHSKMYGPIHSIRVKKGTSWQQFLQEAGFNDDLNPDIFFCLSATPVYVPKKREIEFFAFDGSGCYHLLFRKSNGQQHSLNLAEDLIKKYLDKQQKT